MPQFGKLLAGGDLRSIGKSNLAVLKVKGQKDFDELFKYLSHKDRIVIMRAADAIEKITLQHPSYLAKHKRAILELCPAAKNKELKWHLALLTPRLHLSAREVKIVWLFLAGWASDQKESRIVRVNSLQALYEIARKEKQFAHNFELLSGEIEQENVPSINARIRKLKQNQPKK